MAAPPDSRISVDRFLWIQEFVSRMRELGAPASMDDLFELAGRLYDRNVGGDARAVADAAWARWPTESGPLSTD